MARSYLALMFADRGKLEEGGTHGSVHTGSDGGYLLLGVRTERSPEYHQDVVVEISRFEQPLVNPDGYYSALRTWLLPLPEVIEIRGYQSDVMPANFADATLTVFEGYDGILWDAPGRLCRASRQIMTFRDDLGHKATTPVNH